MTFKHTTIALLTSALATTVSLSLVGCEEEAPPPRIVEPQDEPATRDWGQDMQRGAEDLQRGTEEMGQDIQRGAEDLGRDVERGAEDAGETLQRGAEDTGEALDPNQ